MFKKKEKTEKAPKNKKVRTMKVGTHKKSVLLLWAVLLASTSFGVYKNFTAIDTHTVHEKDRGCGCHRHERRRAGGLYG